jgi:hypothetical protein
MSFISQMSPGSPAAVSGAIDPSGSLHQPGPRPFEPRIYGRREFEKRDVYGFLSIKEARPVEVDGLPAIAVALALECDPHIACYTERPRTLPLGDKNTELHFWVRYASGFEQFLLLVPDADCVQTAGGIPRPRETERWQAMARDAGLQLRFVTEHDVRVAGATIAQHNRLLAFAQVAQSLGNRLALRARILASVEQHSRARVDQLEAALIPFDSADVQAVICELICLGILDFDREQELTRRSVIARRNRT